jgi:hypothetical protein
MYRFFCKGLFKSSSAPIPSIMLKALFLWKEGWAVGCYDGCVLGWLEGWPDGCELG